MQKPPWETVQRAPVAKHTVIDQGRYAIRYAGNPMTCNPSVTGMYHLRFGVIHNHVSIVAMMYGTCNLWFLLAQNSEPSFFFCATSQGDWQRSLHD